MWRYALASQFWRTIPTWHAQRAWQRRSQWILARAASHVPAWRQLVRVFAAPAGPSTTLPLLQTSRSSYLEMFPLAQRCQEGPRGQPATFDPAEAGQPSWPRSASETAILREQLVDVLNTCFDAASRRTLLAMALPEEGWSASRRIGQALHEAIGRGRLRGSLVDLADAARPDTSLVGNCEQCVVLCSPQHAVRHATQLARTASRSGLVVFGPLPPAATAALPPELEVCSVWGIDETGPLLGMQTPLARLLSDASSRDPALCRALTGSAGRLAGIYQPFPLGPSIDQAKDDLLVSSWGAAPLIRYRLGQPGRVMPFQQACHWLAQAKVRPTRQVRRLMRMGSPCWKLPLVLLLEP